MTSTADGVTGAAATPIALAAGCAAASLTALLPRRPSSVLLDYAAGVISARDITALGAIGAIRYVSARRPGAQCTLSWPIEFPEARDLDRSSLEIVSKHQFG
ncbi:hypothetical protein BH11ACT6_BH11ACT6_01620 [soil metagenome]